ncbi:MAG: hypothetical protein ATN35_08865 [Epulopiscium sp. Nele67-Bin004]|nr:MAG: hypothetical protein ATN35_08865 [Epulopiscium sp. Nele67-Bin004]
MGVDFPLSSPLELKFHYHARDMYVFDETWPVFQEMANITNMTLKNTGNIVGTNSVEQFQLAAVDRFPDDIYGGNNITTYFMEYGPDGAFIPLNEYWDYLPNFKAYLDANPDVEAVITAYDGNIYHIPYIQDGDTARTWFIRTDWLDNLGLEVPTTVQELEDVLIAFRDDDPNGNGLNDEIPYFNDKYTEMMRLVNLWDARCYGQDASTERVIPVEDGSVYHAWTADEFRDAIYELSRWYDMGLIDKEIFTKGNAARREYLPGDIGGVTHEWVASTSAYNDTVTGIDGFAFEVFAPPITENGNQWEEHARLKVRPDGWAVSSSCKSPEEAFAYMDYFFSDYGRIISNYGVEGISYELVDGHPTFTDEVLNGDVAVNTFLESEMGAQLKHGYWMDYDYEYQWTHEIGRAGVDLYNSSDFSVLQMPPLVFNEAQKAVIDSKRANIVAYQDEMTMKWIMGSPDLVYQEWDTYLAQCELLGISELVNAYQEAYTSYLEIAGN